MKQTDPLSQISLGEDSTHHFKLDVHNGLSLVSEMAAFANSNGGTIFIGVAYDGNLTVEKIRTGNSNIRNPILVSYKNNSSADYGTLAHTQGVREATIKRHIQKLKKQKRLSRAGSKKTGYWEVLK